MCGKVTVPFSAMVSTFYVVMYYGMFEIVFVSKRPFIFHYFPLFTHTERRKFPTMIKHHMPELWLMVIGSDTGDRIGPAVLAD